MNARDQRKLAGALKGLKASEAGRQKAERATNDAHEELEAGQGQAQSEAEDMAEEIHYLNTEVGRLKGDLARTQIELASKSAEPQTRIAPNSIVVRAPAKLGAFDIAQHIVGSHVLLKAEPVKRSKRTFSRYRALRQSSILFVADYVRQVDRMLKAIEQYIERAVIHSTLGKAEGRDPYSPLITPEQLARIREIVGQYHDAFAITQIGPEHVDPRVVQKLIDEGILPQDLKYSWQPGPGELPPEAREAIGMAYDYGMRLAKDRTVVSMHNDTLAEVLVRPPIQLTEQEVAARDWASRHAAEHIVGLGNTVAADMTTLAIEADDELRKRYQADIREELVLNIEQRESWRELASKLGHKTGDWARDFERIAATEKQNAMQEGLVAGLIDREGDPDETYVAKQPADSACPDCVRLHLTAGQGSPPKVFKLSELIANGSNRGKKRNAWLPVVGVIHPWCHLSTSMVTTPDGPRALALLRPGDRVLTHKRRFRPVQGVAKRAYRQDLVQLVIGDEFLETTPEHPYLTQRGWVPAADIQSGDYLMRILELPSADVGPNNHPAQRFEIGRLLDIFSGLAFLRMPSGVDLYGDENVRQRKVDIEWTYCELRNRIVSVVSQGVGDLLFVFRQVASFLSRLRREDLLLDWTRLAASCGVSLVHHGTASFGVEAVPTQLGAFSGRSNPNSMLAQFVVDSLSVDSEARSKLRSASSSGVHSADFAHGQGGDSIPKRDAVFLEMSTNGVLTDLQLRCDSSKASARFVRDARGVGVECLHNDVLYQGALVTATQSRFYDGEVYSLSVAEDESYILDGVVVHNCSCDLVHVPSGWGFDEEGVMVPLSLKRSELLVGDLRKSLSKSNMTYTAIAPDKGIAIRVHDPEQRLIIENVIAETPDEIFDKRIGVTLITTDHPRVQNPMDDHDLAYWTGNEIRISVGIPNERLAHCIRHELGHSLNVYLFNVLGDVAKVRRWHSKLFKVSKQEGFVSPYAKTLPIENAAELTRLYLYERRRCMLVFPRAFAILHNAYRPIWTNPLPAQPDRPGEAFKQKRDAEADADA